METLILLIAWYAGLLFFGWKYAQMIRAGNASSSGVELLRKKNPVRFWITAIWEGLALAAFATLPVIILLSKE
jgi:hypothetical protein